MNDLEITFEESPWEAFLRTRRPGDSVSAANFLAMLEGEEEQAVEDALADLEESCLQLDISDLPKAGGTGEAALRLRQECQLVQKGLNPGDLEPNDPLRLYLEEVDRMAVSGDEQRLAEKCARGDEWAMEKLTNLGLKRVIAIAGEHVGYGVLLLDLIQEGSLGLWQAVRSYREGDFLSYRDSLVRFYMAKAVTLQARAHGVGQKMKEALEDYRAVDERLLWQLGRNPTLEEIAQELHMTMEEASSVQSMLEDARMLARVNNRQQEQEEEEMEAQHLAVEDTAQFQMRQRILDLLSNVSEEDAKLLTLRFGLEGGKPLSPQEAGKRLGLTPDEVLTREAAALAKLRNG